MALANLASGAHPAATFPNSHLLAPPVAPSSRWAPAAWAAPKVGTALADLREAVRAEDWAGNYSEGLTTIQMRGEWSASDERIAFLQYLAFSAQARRVLEIGSFCGAGTLALAQVLPAAGEVLALELDPFVVRFGQRFQKKSPFGQKIQHAVGPAKESLKRLADEAAAGHLEPFDLVVVDADKECLNQYVDMLWNSPGLMRRGAVMCVDMTPFKGQPPLRFVKFGFPYQCETSSGQEQLEALRASLKAKPEFAAYEFGGLLIVQRSFAQA